MNSQGKRGGMGIADATAAYEKWKSGYIPLRAQDLRIKHARMREAVFPFFRATFYRWMQVWPRVCGDLNEAPRVLAVGDLHVENFGTWRDAEGRLIWGINDFDEAATLPYTLDLVRLAASARLALAVGALAIRPAAACAAILEGYRAGLERSGKPIVLADVHTALRQMATARLHDPCAYWDKLTGLPEASGVSGPMRRQLKSLLPEPGVNPRYVRRVAGLGSLGHVRVVAQAIWRGGWIAREAKQLAPSACDWATGTPIRRLRIRYLEILAGAVRCPDPFLQVKDNWLYRRLAPDCSRIELDSLPKVRDERRLLRAMGFETANIHGGGNSKIGRDFGRREEGWLHRAARDMAGAVEADWQEYRSQKE